MPEQDSIPDSIMLVHKSLAGNLITSDMAIEITKMVLLKQHGEIELNRNLPMTVSDDGAAWLVKGTHSREYNEKYPIDPSWGGPVIMRIAKFDARILFYGFDANLPWLKAPKGTERS